LKSFVLFLATDARKKISLEDLQTGFETFSPANFQQRSLDMLAVFLSVGMNEKEEKEEEEEEEEKGEGEEEVPEKEEEEWEEEKEEVEEEEEKEGKEE